MTTTTEIEIETPQQGVLKNWVSLGMLPNLTGLNVWDIGCGWGDFTSAFIAEGANHVIATDIALDYKHIPESLFQHQRASFREGDTEKLCPLVFDGQFGSVPNILFMHLMTEHVDDLKSFIKAIRSNISADCILLIRHDNYYQPVGHHDHSFLFLDPVTYTVQPQTISCWTKPERCAAYILNRKNLPNWQWSVDSEETVGHDCDQCNYKLRSQPWAHLLYQNEFNKIWPEPFFKNSLNKITIFQIRQFLMEAGFGISNEQRSWISNEIPADLICNFSKHDLQTFAYTLFAKVLK